MGSGAAEVALGAVAVDGDVEAAGRSRRVVLSVGFEGVDEAVGGVIRLLEILGLDLSGLLKGLASFDVCGCKAWSAPLRSVGGQRDREAAEGGVIRPSHVLCFCILKALAAWM